MTAQLPLLIAACPPWFSVGSAEPGRVDGHALLEPWPSPGVALTIRDSLALKVAETEPGLAFPALCHERHIQDDHTFCVGLRRPQITTRRHAGSWWFHLRQFLECQAIADATCLWPPKNALDHGTAGALHQRALQIARKLGIEDDYWEAHLGQPSWITTPGPRWAHPKDREHARRLRKPKIKKTQKAQRMLQELVFVERARGRELAEYRKAVAAYGGPCCGKMRDCARHGPAQTAPT